MFPRKKKENVITRDDLEDLWDEFVEADWFEDELTEISLLQKMDTVPYTNYENTAMHGASIFYAMLKCAMDGRPLGERELQIMKTDSIVAALRDERDYLTRLSGKGKEHR